MKILVTTIAFLVSGNAARAAIFSDNMSTGANWTVVQTVDSSAQFGYDYSQKGVPPAPSGNGDTIGLKFEVNNNQPPGVESVAAYNHNSAFTGQYTLRADVWNNWALVNGTIGEGTTLYTGLDVGHTFTTGILGASMEYNGDGDGFPDYGLYKNNSYQYGDYTQYANGTVNPWDNINPAFKQAFPSINVATAVPLQGQTGATAAGAGGFQWMTINVEVDPTSIGPSGHTSALGWARFSMHSAASGKTISIGTIDNSNGGEVVPLTGGIALMMDDFFPSVTTNPAFSFALFDNVQVIEGLNPIPEPMSALLIIGGALAFASCRPGRSGTKRALAGSRATRRP